MSKADSHFLDLPLSELTEVQWEALCDHCGKCCLLKLEDMDDGRVYQTDIVCKEYDMAKQACSCYAQRLQQVSGCVKVSLQDTAVFRDLDFNRSPDSISSLVGAIRPQTNG